MADCPALGSAKIFSSSSRTRSAEMLRAFYEEEQTARPRPILRGDDLIRELGLKPGPVVGRLLAEVHEAHAVGDISTRDEALEWARRRIHPDAAAE
jgi:tRNA nucleotidyltransferase (CCA-adding enzyme)